jgi:DNA-binding transcriptional MocR family regulator
VTSERVYQRLKVDILSGRYAPGAVLVVQSIADEYGVSISPVRDSAQRLIGERLLAAQPGGGFSLPEVSMESLRDLYIWHGQLIRQALKERVLAAREGDLADARLADAPDPVTLASSASALFALIGARSRNQEHVHAIVSAGERLGIARLAEPELIPDIASELQAVWALAMFGPDAALRDAIWAYHRRRIRRVSRLVKEIAAMSR